jgi:cytochrome d ubiquinol oxidase subunit II
MATIWFLLVGVLIAGYAVLDGFDLGTGVLSPFLARDDGERRTLRAAIGPVWDGNEVWLLTGGGAVFAAFPAVYAMAFSGFYLAIMLVLFGLILRAVSLEFRAHDEGWGRLWDGTFFVGSLVPALLFGVAVGNIIRGVPMNAHGDYAGTFFGLLNPFSLLVGVTGLAAFVSHGAAWISVKTVGGLQRRAIAVRSISHWVFVALVAATTIVTVATVHHHVAHNLGRPLGWLMIVLLVGGIVGARWAIAKGNDLVALLGSGVSILGLVGLAGVGNYPNLVNARGKGVALSVHNAASAHYTLVAMFVIAVIFVPIVLGYTAFMYRTFAGKVEAEPGEY